MGLYIELPENWAKWSLEITDVHGNQLEPKVIDENFDLVRCGECKYYKESEHIKGNMVCKYHIGHAYYTEANRFCCYGDRKADDNIKTIEQIREETKVGDVFTLKEFMEVVERGCINDYDGFGYFHDGDKETDINVFGDIWYKFEVDDVLKRYPYVIWYNK